MKTKTKVAILAGFFSLFAAFITIAPSFINKKGPDRKVANCDKWYGYLMEEYKRLNGDVQDLSIKETELDKKIEICEIAEEKCRVRLMKCESSSGECQSSRTTASVSTPRIDEIQSEYIGVECHSIAENISNKNKGFEDVKVVQKELLVAKKGIFKECRERVNQCDIEADTCKVRSQQYCK